MNTEPHFPPEEGAPGVHFPQGQPPVSPYSAPRQYPQGQPPMPPYGAPGQNPQNQAPMPPEGEAPLPPYGVPGQYPQGQAPMPPEGGAPGNAPGVHFPQGQAPLPPYGVPGQYPQGQPPMPPYGAPGQYPPPYWQEEQNPPSKGFSIAALVLGILSVVCCCSNSFSFVFSILAIVFAIVAGKRNRCFNGMDIAGLVLGCFGFLLTLVSLLLVLLTEIEVPNFDDYYGPPAEEISAFLSSLFRK